MPELTPLDVIIVGAGPAGLGCGFACQAVEGLTVGVVEAGEIAQTFHEWHPSQSMLTPSFTTNGYGAVDLNSVHPLTSPAFTLHTDYPTGEEYAYYLKSLAEFFELPVLTHTEVTGVQVDEEGIFHLETNRGPAAARHLIWAAGEFHSPLTPQIPGGELSIHSSVPKVWDTKPGKVAVIGGYESGVELAWHHITQGSEVWLIDSNRPWEDDTADPSISLSPRSRRRFKEATQTGRLHPIPHHAEGIIPNEGGFRVELENGLFVETDHAPIAATGYGAGLGPCSSLFERREDGWPLLNEHDESTITKNLFLNGPMVRHDRRHFCFIYKFRQRYAYLASLIAQRMGISSAGLDTWREKGMIIDDLSCCGTDCAC